MKVLQLSSLASIVMFLSSAAFGHASGHAPPPKVAVCKIAAECTKEEIMEGAAANIVPKLIDDGPLDKSWTGLKATDAVQKDFKGRKEWVVSIKNPKAEDKAKQTLYVFASLGGQLSGVNFTGE